MPFVLKHPEYLTLSFEKLPCSRNIPAMSCVSSAASFQMVHEQQVTAKEVRMAEQELEASHARDRAVRANV